VFSQRFHVGGLQHRILLQRHLYAGGEEELDFALVESQEFDGPATEQLLDACVADRIAATALHHTGAL
jgi:hypothetical protein